MWHFTHVLSHFHLCSCIAHSCSSLLHVKCLTECPSDSFVLNWIQVNSNFSVYTCLTIVSLVLVAKHVFHTLCLCWSRSLEGLSTAGRLGLDGFLLTHVSELIV